MNPAIAILNGPNLNLLGEREPDVYGKTTLATIEGSCIKQAESLGANILFFQTNHEGELVEKIQTIRNSVDGLIINPAAYTFTSVAIVDALKIFAKPIIELHISNIHARDPIYHKSLVSPVAMAVICGLGALGYLIAIQSLVEIIRSRHDSR